MTYYISDFKKMKLEELVFIFSMMRKYGGMPDPSVSDEKKPHKKHKSAKKPFSGDEYPSLTDFNDPKWAACKDEKFLTFRAIMMSIQR